MPSTAPLGGTGIGAVSQSGAKNVSEFCVNARGFTVATFDWPGQGYSWRLLDNPLKAHIDSFRQYDEALAQFLDVVVKPLGDAPPIALAHSMGAHNIIRMMHDRPNAFAVVFRSEPRQDSHHAG